MDTVAGGVAGGAGGVTVVVTGRTVDFGSRFSTRTGIAVLGWSRGCSGLLTTRFGAGVVTVAARVVGRAVGSISRLTTGAGTVLLGMSGALRRAAYVTTPSAASTIRPAA